MLVSRMQPSRPRLMPRLQDSSSSASRGSPWRMPNGIPARDGLWIEMLLYTGLVELGLAGQPLEDGADLASLLRSFPRLRVLDVAGCQKLSPAAAEVLLPCSGAGSAASAAGGQTAAAAVDGTSLTDSSRQSTTRQLPPARKLQVVDMQRCYQLEAKALSGVLAAAQTSSLSAALLSHLTLEQWPSSSGVGACTEADADSAAAAEPRCVLHSSGATAAQQLRQVTALLPRLTSARTPFAGLRVLALHNCVMLTPTGLQVDLSYTKIISNRCCYTNLWSSFRRSCCAYWRCLT